METLDELHGTLQTLVSMASGVPLGSVILANQGRPALNGLHATFNPIPIRAYGQVRRKREYIAPIEEHDPALGSDWQDLREMACTSMEVLLSVNFYNEGAANAAMRLHNANFRAPVSEFLFRNQIAWRYVGNNRNLAGLMQASVQPRYQADIHLFIEHEVSYPVLRAAGFDIEIIRS